MDVLIIFSPSSNIVKLKTIPISFSQRKLKSDRVLLEGIPTECAYRNNDCEEL